MPRPSRGRPPVDKEFRGSMNRLRLRTVECYLAGDLGQCTYNLATHILALMCERGRDYVSFTMEDTWHTTILQRGTPVATSGPDFEMFEYHVHGALQECQRKLGLLTGRDEAELKDAVERASTGESLYHFTELPGEPRTDEYNYVRPATLLHCQFDETVLHKSWTMAAAEAVSPEKALHHLPNWLRAVEI